MAEFTEYCKTTSAVQLVAVFTAVTLAPLAAIFSVIGMPVDRIRNGLTGRNFFQPLQGVIIAIYSCIMFYIRYRKLIPNSILQTQHHISLLLLSIVVSMTFLVIVETTYVYPVPFCLISGATVTLPWLLLAYVYLEGTNFKQVKKGLQTFIVTMIASFTVLLGHEALGVLYTSQRFNPLAQSGVVWLLGFLKFILRVFYSWALRSHGEMANGMLIFEVKFFNMLYTAIFTQQTTNSMVLLFLLSTDAIKNFYFLVKLNSLGNLYQKDEGKRTRRVLFRTEYIALLQFVEVTTPIVYILYLCLIRQHPNIKFIKGLNRLSDRDLNQSLGNLALLSCFEFICMLGSAILLKLRYNLSVFHQIGFYLSKNKALVISLLNVWSVIAFLGPYTHVGNDYSFRFDSSAFKFL